MVMPINANTEDGRYVTPYRGTTVSTIPSDSLVPVELKTIFFCPRTQSRRTDNGCMHCTWSAKLGDMWFCLKKIS